MKGKRPLAILVALAMLASVFATAPAAAIQDDDCEQANNLANVGNANIDTNVNAGNIALNIPVLSPNTGGGNQTAAASQQIVDRNDDFQSQTNVC